jgi:hypothetical protein
MKPLDPIEWSRQNRGKYPNGTYAGDIMLAYAKYYRKESNRISNLRRKWKSEWYSKHRLLDIDFETYCKMMN